MPQARWRRLRELLEAALDQPTAERLTFLEAHCPDDSLRPDAIRLLGELEAGSHFLESRPALLARAILSQVTAGPRLLAGNILARRFRVSRLLGFGGMGEVYEADDLESGARVAIKIIRGGAPAERTLSAVREELILGRAVTHRNVCRIFDLHHHAG